MRCQIPQVRTGACGQIENADRLDSRKRVGDHACQALASRDGVGGLTQLQPA
jgi:hypothetical protein